MTHRLCALFLSHSTYDLSILSLKLGLPEQSPMEEILLVQSRQAADIHRLGLGQDSLTKHFLGNHQFTTLCIVSFLLSESGMGDGWFLSCFSYMYVKGHSIPHNALYCNILKIKNGHIIFFSFYVYNIKTLDMHKVYACIQHAYTANDHNKSS